MTLLTPSALSRSLGARDLFALRAHLLAGGDPNARALPLGRPDSPEGRLWGPGDRLVHVAIHLGWPEGLDTLLNAGADPEALSEGIFEVRTPLGRTLLKHGPWEHAPHPLLGADTPRSWAASSKSRLACLRLLLSAGASPARRVDGSGTAPSDAMDPMRVACLHRAFDAWVVLQQAGRTPDDPWVLQQIVQEGRVRWLMQGLNVGLNPDQPLPIGGTALHAACRSRHAEAPRVVEALLQRADPDQASPDGERPLHLALANPRHGDAMLRLLLDAGADPNLPNARGVSTAGRCATLLQSNPVHPVARVLEQHSLTRLAEAEADSSVATAPGRVRRRF